MLIGIDKVKIKLAYVIHLFPHGQTDIVNELCALEEAGVDTTIIAVRERLDMNQVRVPFRSRFPILYIESRGKKLSKFDFMLGHLRACFRYPCRYIKTACIAARFKGANFKLAGPLFEALKEVDPDLVYTPWAWSFSGSAMYASVVLDVPFIFAVRGTEIFPPDLNFHYRAQVAKKILTVSEGYARILREKFGIPDGRLVVIRPCLGPTDFLSGVAPPQKEINGPLRLLNIATLRDVKRHSDLVKVARLLKDKGLDYELRICGDGPEKGKIEELIEELSVKDYVKLLGHLRQDKLVAQLQWCDIYVHTSESESFGFALIEAGASGRPIVAYDARGGIRESVISGKSAVLVRVGDIETLAEEIVRLSEDDDLRLSMGTIGREFVREKFSSFDRFAGDFVNTLLEAL